MLNHGGGLRKAAEKYRIDLADWLDLSTGIAPYGWSLPEVPMAAWNRLPELNDGLEQAARQFYGVDELLPVAGSQAAIQALPRLRRYCQVGIVSPCYAEHAEAWRREGHRLLEISEAGVRRSLDRLDVLVVVNPNNPTGRRIPAEQLLEWHARLVERGGWLVVDEAFMDATPEHSLAAHSHLPGLIVLRSFGKFFGMAGLRLGFVLAQQQLLERLDELLGPWAVSGPARSIARSLLLDDAGQASQRLRLEEDGARLHDLLVGHGLRPTGGCSLFQWWVSEHAALLHEYLACHGILTRLYAVPASLRFGLPPDEPAWARLESALEVFARSRE